LNALQLASRSGCGSEDALELAKRCADLLRVADGDARSVSSRPPR
jgi:hypothetical protein